MSERTQEMMPVHWLIEVDVFPETAKRVVAALETLGLRWTRYHDDCRTSELPSVDQPVLFWGSLGAAYELNVAERWAPGSIGDAVTFRCSSYLGRLDPAQLANADSVFTTVTDLVTASEAVLAPLGPVERVFVRPDSALKPFAGRVVAVAELSLAALDHGFYYEDEALPVVVSSPKHVEREWRFVVADNAVVAACEYEASRRGTSGDVPNAARDVANRVATASWQAAPLYIVDVGLVDGAFKVLELNPFSGADLYRCDPTDVVRAASIVAARLHAAQPTER